MISFYFFTRIIVLIFSQQHHLKNKIAFIYPQLQTCPQDSVPTRGGRSHLFQALLHLQIRILGSQKIYLLVCVKSPHSAWWMLTEWSFWPGRSNGGTKWSVPRASHERDGTHKVLSHASGSTWSFGLAQGNWGAWVLQGKDKVKRKCWGRRDWKPVTKKCYPFFYCMGQAFFVDLLYFETAVIMCLSLHSSSYRFSYHIELFFPGRFPYILLLCSKVMSFIFMVLLQCRGSYSLEKLRNHSLKCHGFTVDFYFHVSQPDISPAPQTLSTVRVAKFQGKICPSFPRYPVTGFVSESFLTLVLIESPSIRDNSEIQTSSALSFCSSMHERSCDLSCRCRSVVSSKSLTVMFDLSSPITYPQIPSKICLISMSSLLSLLLLKSPSFLG